MPIFKSRLERHSDQPSPVRQGPEGLHDVLRSYQRRDVPHQHLVLLGNEKRAEVTSQKQQAERELHILKAKAERGQLTPQEAVYYRNTDLAHQSMQRAEEDMGDAAESASPAINMVQGVAVAAGTSGILGTVLGAGALATSAGTVGAGLLSYYLTERIGGVSRYLPIINRISPRWWTLGSRAALLAGGATAAVMTGATLAPIIIPASIAGLMYGAITYTNRAQARANVQQQEERQRQAVRVRPGIRFSNRPWPVPGSVEGGRAPENAAV